MKLSRRLVLLAALALAVVPSMGAVTFHMSQPILACGDTHTGKIDFHTVIVVQSGGTPTAWTLKAGGTSGPVLLAGESTTASSSETLTFAKSITITDPAFACAGGATGTLLWLIR